MSKPTEVRLPVRVRRTIDGDGEMAVLHLVHCEWRGRSLLLDDCADCEDCEQVQMDPQERNSWISCGRLARAQTTPEADLDLEGEITPVMSIVGPRVVCVEPNTSTTLLRDLLLEPGVTGAPVVDSDGAVVGFVSRADLLRNGGPAGATRVSQIMTPLAVTVSETASVAEAAALLSLEGVDRMPVVNNAVGGKVVGVVSALDVLNWFTRFSGYRRRGPRNGN